MGSDQAATMERSMEKCLVDRKVELMVYGKEMKSVYETDISLENGADDELVKTAVDRLEYVWEYNTVVYLEMKMVTESVGLLENSRVVRLASLMAEGKVA
jgi:hypothetical protein